MLVDKRERLNTKKSEEALSEYFHMKEVIMVFINEWVEENDEREFAIPSYGTVVPPLWTIDSERNVYLFEYGISNEYLPSVKRFALVINDEVFCYKMSRTVTDENIIWKGGFGSKDNNIQYTEEADELFKEALKIYGACGSPWEKLEDVDVIL